MMVRAAFGVEDIVSLNQKAVPVIIAGPVGSAPSVVSPFFVNAYL